jgi:hypothetical protein
MTADVDMPERKRTRMQARVSSLMEDGQVVTRATWLAAVAAAALLAGCGGGSSSPPKGFGGPVGSTKPGAKLKIGQTAHVTYQPLTSASDVGDKQRIPIDVTVVSVQKGAISDLSGFDLDAKAKAETPYYVTYKVGDHGKAFPTKFGDPGVGGLDSQGQTQSPVALLLGKFDRCPETTIPDPFEAGQTVERCDVYLLPGSDAITGAQYNGTDAYAASEVTWK